MTATIRKVRESNMNLHKLILTENACYKAGKKITVKGIMVHSTGANNPNLKRYVGPDDGVLGKNIYNNHWNTARPEGKQVCVHAFIGKLADGSIATYQTLPWDMVGWHSGSGSLGSAKNANNTGYIGFEICEDGLTDSVYFNRVYKEAVELCAYLCKQYGLTEKNIICHSEGHKLGIASNHADVMHWFPKHGKSMDTFRAEVGKILSASLSPTEPKKLYRVQVGAYSVKANADAMLAKVKAAGFTDAYIKYGK
jgi:N-acetylmuramoyl-L-alanine amidase